ncbi:MAG: ribonuclease P protein component [Fimbriimonadales bacterium]|nr:ribonuclease P protein component [Fimbriimonadales bacterium]
MARLAGPRQTRFEQIFREGHGEVAPGLRVRCLPGTGRVGLAVSRAVGSTPRRNRARRRFREALLGSEALRPDRDYVFVLGERALTEPLPALRAAAEELLVRLNARCAGSPSS